MKIGPYEILGELGRGGMGVVYRARHATLGHEVALKVLGAGHVGDAAAPTAAGPLTQEGPATNEALARFRREAQAASRLAGHPNVVGVRDCGESAGVPWLAMDLVEGRTLADVCAGGDCGWREAVRLVAAAARGVAHAHAAGLLHRDLKPGNILVDRDGTARVADFGLARATRADLALTRLTRSGELIGTPAYMAPEQARGDPVDVRTDVWSLGVTLYEAVTGVAPFDAGSASGTVVRVLRAEPRPLRREAPHAPRELEAVVTACLEKSPDARYPTVAALADDLDRILRGEPPQPPRQPRRRGSRRVVAAGAVGLALAAAAVAWHPWARGGDAALAGATDARHAADRAARVADAYAGLAVGTRAAMRALEDHRHGAPLDAAACERYVAEVTAAADAVAARNPDLRLPAAWSALARFFARDTDPALEALERATAEAGDDPFPAVCLARALLDRWARRAELPDIRYARGTIRVGTFAESAAMAAWRTRAEAALAGALASPLWPHLAHGREVATFAEGAAALAAGRHAEAAARLSALTEDPALDGVVGTLRGLACYLASDFAVSAAAFERAARRGWTRPQRDAGVAHTAVAAGLLEAGRDAQPTLTRALALLDAACASRPADEQVWLSRGIAHRLRAEAALAARADPRPALDAALADYDQVLVLVPNHAVAHSNRGRVLRQRGQATARAGGDPFPEFAAALASYDAALARDPGYTMARANRANLRHVTARAREERNADPRPDYRAAIADYDAVLVATPDDPEIRASRAEAFATLAKAEEARGEDGATAFAAAITDFDVVCAARPDEMPWLIARGDAWLDRSRAASRRRTDARPAADRAVADFTAVLARRPTDGRAHQDLGTALRQRGVARAAAGEDPIPDYQAAIAALGEAAARAVRPAGTLNALGSARQSLARAVEAAKGDPEPHYAAAVADFDAALAADPALAAAWCNRGMVREQLARLAKKRGEDIVPLQEAALADFREALRRDPDYAPAWLELAEVLEALKRRREARDALATARGRFPDHPGIREAAAKAGVPEGAGR